METEEIKISPRCPIRTTLELVGGKWKLLILVQLVSRPLRLAELKKQIPGISEKMLIQELKVLLDSGMVQRVTYGEAPPRVQYHLTDQGKLILPLLEAMRNFAADYEKLNIPG